MGKVTQVLQERETTYGDFHTQANLSQTLKSVFNQHYTSTHPNESLPSFMVEAIHMICHKIARIGNGNPYYMDSWQDIAGYAQLVVDIVEEATKKAKENQVAANEAASSKITNLKEL